MPEQPEIPSPPRGWSATYAVSIFRQVLADANALSRVEHISVRVESEAGVIECSASLAVQGVVAIARGPSGDAGRAAA